MHDPIIAWLRCLTTAEAPTLMRYLSISCLSQALLSLVHALWSRGYDARIYRDASKEEMDRVCASMREGG